MATSTRAISAEGIVRSMVNWKETKCGKCKIQRGRPVCNSRFSYDKFIPIAITNADHIRSMSDEELAVSRVDRIDFYTKSDIPEYIGDFAGIANSIEEAIALEIKWLQSEVEE